VICVLPFFGHIVPGMISLLLLLLFLQLRHCSSSFFFWNTLKL
jgi:hypothetical protein